MEQLDSCEAIDCDNVESLETCLIDAFQHASAASLPSRQFRAHKPWISQITLELIEQRALACSNNEHGTEMALSRKIKHQAKLDRARWLDSKIANSEWSAIRKLKKKRIHHIASLRGSNSSVVSSVEMQNCQQIILSRFIGPFAMST